MANFGMKSVALQVRRIHSTEPEDDEKFISRVLADFQFLIVALRRLRRSALLALKADDERGSVRTAIDVFDKALPGLAVMRNVGEHIDSYGTDDPQRHHQEVDRRQLEVNWWDGTTFTWLQDKDKQPLELNVDEAEIAARTLYNAVRALLKSTPPSNPSLTH